MSPTVLVAGVDARGLPLEAQLLRRNRIPLEELSRAADVLARAVDEDVRLVVLGPAVGAEPAAEVASRLRAQPTTRSVSILVLLPAGTPDVIEQDCRDAGVNAVLRRPLDPAELETWLAKLLSVARRIRTRLPVQAQVVGTERSTGASFVGMLRNLSVNGLLLESPLELESGRDLELEFPLPGAPGPAVRVLGRVVRQAAEVAWPHLGYGVEFIFLSDDVMAAVSEFVAAGLGQASPVSPSPDDTKVHATIRREHWVYEIVQPSPRSGVWQVEIRRAAREGWRPGAAGPFYVVEGATPELALREARDFLRRTPER